jgi:hypothetical protein
LPWLVLGFSPHYFFAFFPGDLPADTDFPAAVPLRPGGDAAPLLLLLLLLLLMLLLPPFPLPPFAAAGAEEGDLRLAFAPPLLPLPPIPLLPLRAAFGVW